MAGRRGGGGGRNVVVVAVVVVLLSFVGWSWAFQLRVLCLWAVVVAGLWQGRATWECVRESLVQG